MIVVYVVATGHYQVNENKECRKTVNNRSYEYF